MHDERSRNKIVVYSKLLTTKNKKHYAGLLLAELGKMVNKPAEDRMDIKGLPIRKSSVPKDLREKFTDYLLQNILVPDHISMKTIVREYDNIVNSVRDSLVQGECKYLIPSKVELLDSYKFPERMQQVRGVLAWNALEPDTAIVPPDNLNLIKLKTGTTLPKDISIDNEKYKTKAQYYEDVENYLINQFKEYKDLKESHPDKFDAIMKVIYGKGKKTGLDLSSYGFAIVAIPKEKEIPEYLRPFIDYDLMVESNTSAGTTLVGSLGIHCTKGKKKSNIIKL